MSVYEQFFNIDIDEEKAYEAPEDLAKAANAEAEALDVAADEVNSEGGETIEESDIGAVEDEDEVGSEESEKIPTEEPSMDEDEIPTEDEEGFEDEESLMADTFEDPIYEHEKKINVFNNTKRLLEIVNQNKETFELRYGKGLSPDLAKEFRLIDKNFTDFIRVAETTLGTKFASRPYNALMRYYVSLTKVYDIITRMTENFVNKYNEEISN